MSRAIGLFLLALVGCGGSPFTELEAIQSESSEDAGNTEDAANVDRATSMDASKPDAFLATDSASTPETSTTEASAQDAGKEAESSDACTPTKHFSGLSGFYYYDCDPPHTIDKYHALEACKSICGGPCMLTTINDASQSHVVAMDGSCPGWACSMWYYTGIYSGMVLANTTDPGYCTPPNVPQAFWN